MTHASPRPWLTVIVALLLLLRLGSGAVAMEAADATGRTVTIPDHVAHVLPAGPPAAVLLAAIAPTEIMGFVEPLSAAAREALPPALGSLPVVTSRAYTRSDPL